ncbi:8930_t:CDS:2 [Diversispora eburnea]|uniref:8930_t:CDS:1 n=1 Tax=Diversispora eburnea TaxID=1213867 RepID=A0A9N9GBC0_9GLOM|nr:8930_t:CDS:2 [Diversispora eburnea]
MACDEPENKRLNIKEELAGEELAPFEIINDHFDKSSTHIRVIVQPPTTTDQERINIQSCNLDYLPRQGYSIEGVSLTDPDISMRSEIIPSLIKDLMQKKIILIRSPPYSGKTSLAQLLENYLVQSQDFSEYRVIRISMLWASAVKMKCNWETFGTVWEKIIGVSWIEWIGQCKSIPSILIMDEVQKIYKDKHEFDESMKNTETAMDFWDTIKANLQESSNVYIIMFGAYGYGVNSAGLSTPVSIPAENSKSLLDIKFTDDELWNYVEIFCNRHFVLLDNNILNDIISKFNKYIQKATAGHVGLVRHILHNTKSAMEWRIRENVLTWKDIFAYLNSNRFNLTIDECRASPQVKSFSVNELDICESVYLNGKILFRPSNTSIQQLVKSGVLVVIDGELYFSAPLIMRSFFQQCYGSHNSSEITPSSLYHFIVKTFTAICNGQSGKLLRETLGFGTDGSLLEQTWQKEFYRVGTQVLGKNHFLSCDVGAVFGCDGYIDFYVDKLEWAIELLRDGKDKAEHSRRFEPAGKYKEIVRYAKSIAIIDVRSESKKVRKLQRDFIHVSCSENYDAFKIECLGKESLTIKIKD